MTRISMDEKLKQLEKRQSELMSQLQQLKNTKSTVEKRIRARDKKEHDRKLLQLGKMIEGYFPDKSVEEIREKLDEVFRN